MRLLLIALLVTSPALADTGNTDLFLQGKREVHLSRPISVVVTDDLPAICDQTAYACAPNAYGKGRCIVYIRPDKLQFIFHELQHCSGLTHTPHGD